MDLQKIAHAVDHTLLKVDATWEQVQKLCDEAVRWQTASVCIPPAYAARAAAYLNGRVPVCVVIGFPNGYSTTASKVFEAKDAVANGAAEIDMVVNVGAVKDGRYDEVLEEIRQVKAACGDHILKVIIETCLLTEEEKIRMCEVVTASGADYIKTSTGFSTGGATPEDVSLLRKHVGPAVKVKAAGGIHSISDAERFLELGADRLGTSSLLALLQKARQ